MGMLAKAPPSDHKFEFFLAALDVHCMPLPCVAFLCITQEWVYRALKHKAMVLD